MPNHLNHTKLTVDLKALGENYDYLNKITKQKCAAIVKANSYGAGLEACSEYLYKNHNLSIFFVATYDEALRLRKVINDCEIFLLAGFLSSLNIKDYIVNNITPTFNSKEEIIRWYDELKKLGSKTKQEEQSPPCAIHYDSGINRLGLTNDEIDWLLGNQEILSKINICLIMSHLACADEVDNEYNNYQLKKFIKTTQKLPPARLSLSNSAGILLGNNYHFDLCRPGISLYGGACQVGRKNNMKVVSTLESPILQLKDINKGEYIGYGNSYKASKNIKTATISLGYADGYSRILSSSKDKDINAYAHFKGYNLPIIGRISMDLIIIDITKVGEEMIKAGDLVELLGKNIHIDDLAFKLNTIPNDVLTAIGDRVTRVYVK